MRQLCGAAVLLHVEAQQRSHVVEHVIAIRVAKDGGAGRPVPVVCGRRVAEVARGGAGDSGVDGIVAAREVDRIECGQRADLIGWSRAAVVRSRLERGVPDTGIVRVREHVVIAEDVDGARAVHDARPDRAGSDRRMAHREAQRRRTLSRRGIAERHQHARHLRDYGNALERAREPAHIGTRQQDLEARLAVRQQAHGGADHAGQAQEGRAVPLVHGEHGVNLLQLIPGEVSLSRWPDERVG